MAQDIRHWTFKPSDGVPEPVAPYSHAVSFGDVTYITGQVPIDPVSDQVVVGGIAVQTHQVMANLKHVLAGVGSSLDRTLFVRVYLSSMDLYEEFNRVYVSYFEDKLPARTCVSVSGMARNVDLEIDMIVANQLS